MRKGMIVVVGALVFLAGCGRLEDKAGKDSADSKWKGLPYRITFATKAQKPNPAGITIPVIAYTANPEALERRANLVVRFDSSGVKRDYQVIDQMIMGPADLSGPEGTLAPAYMDSADTGLARLLAGSCMKGKVKVTVALVRSSLNPQANGAELNNKRLSDWLTIELEYKNPHPKC